MFNILQVLIVCVCLYLAYVQVKSVKNVHVIAPLIKTDKSSGGKLLKETVKQNQPLLHVSVNISLRCSLAHQSTTISSIIQYLQQPHSALS
jgi:hypothetical protein